MIYFILEVLNKTLINKIEALKLPPTKRDKNRKKETLYGARKEIRKGRKKPPITISETWQESN